MDSVSEAIQASIGATLSRTKKLLEELDVVALERFIKTIIETSNADGCLYICGNGGSAATASHMVNDLTVGCGAALGLRSVALSDATASITAISNDFGYDQIFSRQLEVMARPDDVVCVISCSGNSPNLVRAVEWAKTRGIKTFGLLGFDGGKLSTLLDDFLLVATDEKDYGSVESLHMVIDHILMDYFKRG